MSTALAILELIDVPLVLILIGCALLELALATRLPSHS